ncbi:MAG: NINE protein [Alphaproteobacteria bacterium]|nr:NINE protein [Alphaproteobacteria bacterium]
MKRNRLVYILLALFLGGLGIHNFYAVYTKKAIIQLLCVIPGAVLVIPAIIEFIWVLVDICTVTKDADGKAFE